MAVLGTSFADLGANWSAIGTAISGTLRTAGSLTAGATERPGSPMASNILGAASSLIGAISRPSSGSATGTGSGVFLPAPQPAPLPVVQPEPPAPVYKKWWFWALIIGVPATGIGGYLLLRRK